MDHCALEKAPAVGEIAGMETDEEKNAAVAKRAVNTNEGKPRRKTKRRLQQILQGYGNALHRLADIERSSLDNGDGQHTSIMTDGQHSDAIATAATLDASSLNLPVEKEQEDVFLARAISRSPQSEDECGSSAPTVKIRTTSSLKVEKETITTDKLAVEEISTSDDSKSALPFDLRTFRRETGYHAAACLQRTMAPEESLMNRSNTGHCAVPLNLQSSLKETGYHDLTSLQSAELKQIQNTNYGVHSTNLPFGYFGGRALFRNQLNPRETLEDDHVTIRNLIPPGCNLALVTTFEVPMIGFVEQQLAGIDEVLLVAHTTPFDPMNRLENVDGPCVGQAQARPFSAKHPHWRWIAVRPHVGIMHAKILLFRCPEGLRIVVSGNNFTHMQWTCDRDCLWVQDLPEVDPQDSFCVALETQLDRLRIFVGDLISSPLHDTYIQPRLDKLFKRTDGIALQGMRFVFSFPRRSNLEETRADRGGWKHLALGLSSLRRELGDKFRARPGCCEIDLRDLHLWAMAGSLGDLNPDYIQQMRLAMSGQYVEAESSTTWEHLWRTYILWPSRETMKLINPMTSSGRPTSWRHWQTIPLEHRQRLFFDALPSPPEKALSNGEFHAFAHGKVMLAEQDSWAAMYVGSHNFSQTAWGVRSTSPKNCEFGVLLFTNDKSQLKQWIDRLPYKLPSKDSVETPGYDMGRPLRTTAANEMNMRDDDDFAQE